MHRYRLAVVFLITSLFCLLAVGVGPGADARSTKTTVCHCPPGNPDDCRPIVISESAVAAHLGHGDYLIRDDHVYSLPLMETAEGRAGDALVFDGTADRMQVPGSPSLQFSTGSITAAVWVNPDAGSTGWRTLLSKGSEWPLPLYLYLWDNEVGLLMAGPLNSNWDTSVTASPGEWTHIAVTYDPAPGSLQLFKNGVLDDNLDLLPHPLALGGNADPLYVGYNSLWPEEAFDGLLDEVRLYDRALAASEVAELYATPGAPLSTFSDEVARFSFDDLPFDLDRQVVEDLTTNMNNGTLNPNVGPTPCGG